MSFDRGGMNGCPETGTDPIAVIANAEGEESDFRPRLDAACPRRALTDPSDEAVREAGRDTGTSDRRAITIATHVQVRSASRANSPC